jgi:hypothetical protein
MELSWSLLLLLVLMLATAWFWHDSLGAREQANRSAFETCQGLGAQLLDGTVSFRRISTVRTDGGPLRLQRTYVFEYTIDGASRLQGTVILIGGAVDSVIV